VQACLVNDAFGILSSDEQQNQQIKDSHNEILVLAFGRKSFKTLELFPLLWEAEAGLSIKRLALSMTRLASWPRTTGAVAPYRFAFANARHRQRHPYSLNPKPKT
jgi:hypothetical protein